MESDFDGSKEEQVFNDTVREYVVSISLKVWQKLNRKIDVFVHLFSERKYSTVLLVLIL